MRKIEKKLSSVQKQADDNSNMVRDLALIAYGNTIAIEQLNITTTEMRQRINTLESQMSTMTVTVTQLGNRVDHQIRISLAANLISQVQQSLNTGYDVLKDVIHCSLMGQTSPLLLPLDQIDIVQNKVRKVSTSVLDPDFVKMQSVVVSDPTDAHLLLVIINLAAVGREELEIVKLIPVPYYEEGQTFLPILDYNTIVLDQLERSYSVLPETEEISCLSDRCYISDVERPVSDKTCGIPQFYGEHLDVCVAEEITTNGVFLRPMLPDGVLFAFREEVTTQLFCQGIITGQSRKLQGTGVLQLPNGCLLSVVNKAGVNTRVKGPPLYRMMDADDLSLVMSGPLHPTHSSSGNAAGVSKKTTYEGLITSHLSTVFTGMQSANSRLDNQDTYIWGLVGSLVLVGMITIVIGLLLYRYSSRFRVKVRDLRDRFTEINRQIMSLINTRLAETRGLPPPAMPPFTPRVNRILQGARKKLGQMKGTIPDPETSGTPNAPSPYVSTGNLYSESNERESTYISLKPEEISPNVRRYMYPRLDTTFKSKFSDIELKEFMTETEEVSRLCPQSDELASRDQYSSK